MSPSVWSRRVMAAITAGLALLVIASLTAIVGDILTVNTARAAAPLSAPPVPPAVRVRPAYLPLVRAPLGAPEPAIGAFLNVRLSDLGVLVNSARVTSLRPLGGGLSLTEVRVTGTGDASAVASVANWVAVNREAVRLSSVALSQDPDGKGQITFVLLMVIA